jgi:hypothetical protein
MKRILPPLLFSLISFMLVANASATTYYIAANGSDTNNGTSESAPWAHLPGMATWTGSHTPTAGDTYILRGCDTWGNANFPISWNWSGTSNNPITVNGQGDPNWYNATNCPGGWNRPVFNAGGSSINPPDCPSGSGSHFFLVFTSASHVEMQWIEMTGLYWNNDQQNTCYESAGFISNTASDYLTIDNFYFHGWTHGTSSGTTDSSDLIAFTTYGNAPYCLNCYLQNSVIDNSDGDGALPTTISGGGVRNWNLVNSVCSHVVQCFLSPTLENGTYTIAGNNISYINMSFTVPTQSTPPHPNCIETVGVSSGGPATYLIHDNYIHDIQTCEGLQVGNPNESDYVWNNIWDMGPVALSGANGPQVPQGSSSGTFFFANNTVRWGTGCMTAGIHGTNFSSFIVENNHCINDSQIIVAGSIPGSTLATNVGMTNAVATTQGYTLSELYVYSPTLATNGTVISGTDLTATTPGCGTAGMSSLCSDTVYAASEQTVSGVVTAVASDRVTNPRTTTWNAGAYEWNNPALSPPTGLAAVVQ